MNKRLVQQTPLPTWLAIPAQPYTSAHLYLHGSGERGDDDNKLRRWSLPGLIDRGLKLPFMIAAPICPIGRDWGEPGLVSAAFSSVALLAPPHAALKLTIGGFSMGARGAWIAAQQSLVRRALIVSGRTAPNLLSVPVTATQIKVVHGAVDDHQLASEMRRFCGRASQIGVAIEYEELPGKGHFIADETYSRFDVIDWLTV